MEWVQLDHVKIWSEDIIFIRDKKDVLIWITVNWEYEEEITSEMNYIFMYDQIDEYIHSKKEWYTLENRINKEEIKKDNERLNDFLISSIYRLNYNY